MRSFTALPLALAVVVAAAPAAAAMPVVPDNLPIFPQVNESPQIRVTDEQGRSIEGKTMHRGDVLLVHGSGFDPNANRGGFVLPVPPGVPNGLFVLYGAFPEHWKPSEGVPGSVRTHPHDRMAWVMPAGTLDSIPAGSVDMRRSIARQAQAMNADGTFTARVVVDPPANTTGDKWGIYVYPGAGSVDARQEFFVPIPYSPDAGPNTPAAATPDLLIDAAAVQQLAKNTRGGVNPTNGAAKQGADRLSFSRDKASETADGVRHYRGTVTVSARFNMVEVAVADPWLEPRDDGTWAVTALVSTAHNVGKDSMQRREIGRIPKDAQGPIALKAGTVQLGTVEVAR